MGALGQGRAGHMVLQPYRTTFALGIPGERSPRDALRLTTGEDFGWSEPEQPVRMEARRFTNLVAVAFEGKLSKRPFNPMQGTRSGLI
jgi:hypothetical protein